MEELESAYGLGVPRRAETRARYLGRRGGDHGLRETGPNEQA